MAQFLDAEGLSALVTKIKSEDKKITTMTGTARSGHTLEGDIEALESLVGNDTVTNQITTALSNAGISSSSTRIESRLATAENSINTITGDENTSGSINKSLKDAKAYADSLDSDTQIRINTLAGLHGKNESGTYKTVAQQAEEAVARITAGASEALDTFQEVATWINNNTGNVADGYNAAAKIDANTTAITQLTGDKDTNGSVANLINAESSRVDAILGANFTSSSTVSSAVSANTSNIDNLQIVVGYSALATEGKDSLTVKSRLETTEADIATLNGNSATKNSVAYSIKNAIDALTNTVGSTTVNTDKNVAVQVAQVSGKITGLTVTQKDIASAQSLTNLQNLVGSTSLAEGASSVLSRLETIETAVGTGGSVSDMITSKINELDEEVMTDNVTKSGSGSNAKYTLALGAKIGVSIEETDGKLSGVRIYTNDIASASDLSQLQNDVDAITAITVEAVNKLFADDTSNTTTTGS